MKKAFSLIEVMVGIIIISCLIAWMSYGGKKEKTPPIKQVIEESHQAVAIQDVVVLQDTFERAKLTQVDILTNTTVESLCNDLKTRNLLDRAFNSEHVVIQSGSLTDGTATFAIQP